MRKVSSLVATLVCVALCAVASFAQAQQPTAPQPAASATNNATNARKSLIVGVVDLRSIVQSHPIMVDEIPALGAKLQQENLELVKVRQEAEQNMAKLAQEFKAGSPEYEERIVGLRKEVSDAQFKAAEAQQKIIAQRTQLLYRVFKDLQAAVQAVAVQNGVIIVHAKVKLTPTPDSNVSEEVVALEEADNNTIVWNRPECDLTDAVIKQLHATVGTPNGDLNASNSTPLNANLGAQALSAAATPANQQPATAAATAARQPAAAQPAARTANSTVPQRR
ncbi:MAG: OmpH family outer membrane protein [Planctomycetia bacterium]|nr:OmpH family outer membrane protein [Planctomycetia bacterium]